MLRSLLFAPLAVLALTACTTPPVPEDGTDAMDGPDSVDVDPTRDPALVGTRWRLQSLGGEPPVEGVRPVLILTSAPAERDSYDRPYPPRFAGWRIVSGESGVGRLQAPYRLNGDSLRFARTYDYTRLSTPEEEAQAKRLSNALEQTRTYAQNGQELSLFDADHHELARFSADPPRTPTPLDDIEWVLSEIGGTPPPPDTRATLTFRSKRLDPGPEDGFDAFGGYSGCNWYGGGYRLQAEGDGHYRLTTNGPVTSTARGCGTPASDVEESVQRAISRATRVRVTGDGEPGDWLILIDSTGTERLTFRRHHPYPVDLGALRRGRWLLHSAPDGPPPAADSAFVTFADSTFESTAGCFRVRGQYRVERDNLTIPMMGADTDACPPGERGRPRPIPITSGKLSVTADSLKLYDENGRETVFTRPR